MIRIVGDVPPVLVEWEPTPEERSAALVAQNEFRKNAAWFGSRAREIRDAHSGRFICVAGQELFVGDDPTEVTARARAAHPQGGFFSRRLSTHRGPKIYAN